MEENKKTNLFEGIDQEIAEAKKSKPSDNVDNNQELNLNLRPKLGKWASLRQKKHLKSIARKEQKALAKEQEAERAKNGQVTKKDVAKAYGWVIAQGLVALSGIILGVTATLPVITFLAGIVATASIAATISNIKDARKKHKEYGKENPKVKKEKTKKEKKPKEKKLGLGKRIKNFFTKSKNKSEDSNEQIVNEIPVPNSTPVETETEENSAQLEMPQPKETVVNYSLDQNGPKVATVDLSNISMKPGLDVNVQHFVVRKDDEIMQELVSQYIEKTTGCPAMYADRIIDNEEKRVYMLTR